ncbi:MAG: hypothetical protein J6Y67_05185 [Lachnospiraceae bacterium]|nr:hypothetical protein [Lachnospiraceae bacterium]
MDCFQLEQSSEELRAALVARQDLLEQFLAAYGDRLRGSPEGTIRINHRKNRAQYYFREHATDRWKYLPLEERSKVGEVVNRDYLESIVLKASEELREIKRLLARGLPVSLKSSFQKFSSFRQSFIQPLYATDEEVIQEFYAFSYDPLSTFAENKKFETIRGEQVRSKAEWMIAQKLDECGVPYQYEPPLRLKGFGTVRPDFRCLNVRRRKIVYWEHFGKMGDNEYASETIQKVNAYGANGFHVADNLIITEETGDCPLTPGVVENWIQRILLK